MNIIYYVFIRIIDIFYLVKQKIYLFIKTGELSNKFFYIKKQTEGYCIGKFGFCRISD